MEIVYNYLQKQFSPEIAKRLIEADTISAFLLDPKKITNDKSKLFNGFYIVDRVNQLEKREKKFIVDIIENKRILNDSILVKNCTFLPDIGFRLYDEDKSYTDILVAFYCNDWLFINKKKRIITDCKKIRKDLLNLAKSTFPNDEFLKKIPIEND